MKKPINKLRDEDLVNYPLVNLVDGWFFRIEEISFGAYKVEGIDRWGRIVFRVSIEKERDELLRKCSNDARSINTELREQRLTTPH